VPHVAALPVLAGDTEIGPLLKKLSPKVPFMESPNVKIKAGPADAVSFLSPPRPRDKNKKLGQTIEISSSEEENASPTPKAKR
jgi:hypothetical protein